MSSLSRAYHGDKPSNEAEVGQVVWVDGGGGVDLQTVVVLSGILKQAVHWVQHFMRQQEEPFSTRGGGERRQAIPLWLRGFSRLSSKEL